MIRPRTRAGSSSAKSRWIASGPSYSSPWLAPVSRAVGPAPPLMTASGIMTEPQALSSREWGRRRNP